MDHGHVCNFEGIAPRRTQSLRGGILGSEPWPQTIRSEAVGCSSCHSGDGAPLTNNQNADVGTGGVLQVPSLRNVSFRAPLRHDGCAATLADRFGACGGGDQHGRTNHLRRTELADLIAYLEML